MSHDLRTGAGRHRDCWPGRVVRMRCLECGVETAEATPACVVCGAPAPRRSAAVAWRGSRGWVKRYSVRQRRSWVKPGQAAEANALAGPGGTGDSTADPPDGDAASWAVPAAIGASVGQQPEGPRVFRTGELRLIYAASCPSRNSSITSCGVRYPSPEWRRVRL